MISYPAINRNTNMYTDLACEFLDNGHEVYVIAPAEKSTEVRDEQGIKVLRIKTLPLFNTSFIIKGIANLLLPYQYKYAIKQHFKNICFDVVAAPTPPITFIETLAYLKKKHKSIIYLILRDIFPQNAKDLGLITNNLLFNYFRRKEKKLYRIADHIGCMSPKNIDFVLNNNCEVNSSKLHLLPNWTTVNSKLDPKINVRSKFNLGNMFVAIFGGNFGIPQKIDFLVEIAERIKEMKDILFILVGEGTEKNKIQEIILDKKLSNIIIIDSLPRVEYMELLNECDLGLVNLSDKFTIPNIPSRTLSYWALKLPVLAAIDVNTDYGTILTRCEGGLWSVMGDSDSYISNLLLLYNKPELRKRMGENGYNYLVNELTTEKAYNTILSRII